MRRLRSSFLLLILSVSVGLAACSDTSTNSDTDGKEQQNEQEQIEPSASVNNPEDGAVLEGEITFSIEGEAENGFDEARIYVGEDLVETVNSPTLPYEHTIKTYEYDNGDYDLSAELDVSEADTTVSASISVTLENYLVELETDGFIAALKERYDAVFMFISDTEGHVLSETELTAQSDGVMKLLPPEELENGAPEWFDITFVQKTTDYQGRDALYLNTDVGLEPWKRIYKSGTTSKAPGPRRELTVEMSNFSQIPFYTAFQSTEYIDSGNIFYWDHYAWNHGDPLVETFEVAESSENLVITHTPDPNQSNPIPLYRWEDNLSELSNSISYNVSQDFTPMVAHSVDLPSGFELMAYAYFMTIDPNSFDKGDVNFTYWPVNNVVDANSSNSEYDIWIPEITSHSFISYFDGLDTNDPNIRYRYQTAVGDFPNQMKTTGRYEIQSSSSLDNVSLDTFDGGGDYARIIAEASSGSYYHRWSVVLDNSSYTFPKIADSLVQSVAHYSRSNFELSSAWATETDALDGYDEYLDWQYGNADYAKVFEFIQTIVARPTTAKKRFSSENSDSEKSITGRSLELDPHIK